MEFNWEVDRLFNEAENFRLTQQGNKTNWTEVGLKYKRVIDFVNESSYLPKQLFETVKLQAMQSIYWQFYCQEKLNLIAPPDLNEYDSPSRLALKIKKLEQDIRKYRSKKSHVYNFLQSLYDQLGEELRNQGWKYMADELQYHMLKARTKWKLYMFSPSLFRLFLIFSDGLERFILFLDRILPHFLLSIKRRWDAGNEFARAGFEWLLYLFGKGIAMPFIVFMVVPIIGFAFIYNSYNCVNYGNNEAQKSFWDSLAYSVFVYTGSEAGSLSMCNNIPNHQTVHYWMAAEAFLAFIFMVLVIGYLVNRLSSR